MGNVSGRGTVPAPGVFGALILVLMAISLIWSAVTWAGGEIKSFLVAPTPTPTPALANSQPLPPPGCIIHRAKDSAPGDCSARYIEAHDLYESFHSCWTVQCYRDNFYEVSNSVGSDQMVLVYRGTSDAQAEEREQLQKEMKRDIQAVGEKLKDRSNSGETNQLSVPDITDLVDKATREIDDIDVPIDSTPEQTVSRLGLIPSIRLLTIKF